MSLAALITTLVVVFPVELPDKTLVATLILASRYRPLPVFVGVSAAFAVQCVIAVAFGSLLHLFPPRVVSAAVAALFLIGAIVLWRSASAPEEAEIKSTTTASPARMAMISFGVLFAAEWGDASQLAVAALTARFHEPLSVGLGGFIALVAVAGIAILLGRGARKFLKLHILQRIAAVVFLGFALVATYAAVFP